jgi:hypothetical protein
MALWPLEKRHFVRFFEPFSPKFSGFFCELAREGAREAPKGLKKVLI